MKTKIVNYKSFYALVIDQPGVRNQELARLATATHYFSSGCWIIEDVRATRFHNPSKWFAIGADHYQADCETKSESESDLVRTLIKDFKETANDCGGSSFSWCTFEGIAAGKTAEEITKSDHGYPLHDVPIFFNRTDAIAQLADISDFWSNVPIDSNDPDVIETASEIRIPNPHRQLSGMEVSMKVFAFQEGQAKRERQR